MATAFAPFPDIVLAWDGREYRIPARKTLAAIDVLESVVTLEELARDFTTRGTVRLSKLAQAFGALLRYAGAQVEDLEVYRGLFGSDSVDNAVAAVASLIALMTPPTQPTPSLAETPAPFPAAEPAAATAS